MFHFEEAGKLASYFENSKLKIMIIAAWIILVFLGAFIPEIFHQREEKKKQKENERKLKNLENKKIDSDGKN